MVCSKSRIAFEKKLGLITMRKMKKRIAVSFIIIIVTGFCSLATAQPWPSGEKPAPQGLTQPPPKQPSKLEAEAVTPPLATEFRDDYRSLDPNRIMKWISPKRGLVEDGILMTFDETRKKLQSMQDELKGFKIDMTFVRGYYTGSSEVNDFYRGFYELTMGQGKVSQSIKTIAIFEKINSQWFLVQTQNLRLAQNSPLPTMDKPTLEPNMLMVGDHVPEFNGTIQGKTTQKFSSELAQRRGRPVLLNFFTRISGDFGAQLDWAQTLYPKYKGKNVYIFCVTDDAPEFLKPYLAGGKWKIAVLHDDKSLIHLDLKIDISPYIMLIDQNGVVRVISRGYNKSSLGLVDKILNDVIDQANQAMSLSKKNGPPIHKQ